eukprot:CAMPEP_0113637642 /NCGR_PEP_ID=MMETSP0017_2-20120614/19710_1 /TAXON_ID=2856 /ORGANISM="Cylindrotheca closterium" /LENGTH=149 /DNA_ID=CAMNT_0000548693 /DNA_START=808 /DNA_END=1260 /DNA_ORIENTATION=- /assembly_acc=CAM_ASM_000147
MASPTKMNYLSSPTYAYDTPMVEVSDATPQSSAPQTDYRSTNTRVNMDEMLAKKYYETDLDITISGSRRPIQIPLCPHCGAEHVRTHTRTHPNAATWAGVGVGAVVFFPLCWVPLVSDGCKKTDHYCQHCHNKIGTVKPFEGFCVKEQY